MARTSGPRGRSLDRRYEREDGADDPSEGGDEPEADRDLLLGPADELEMVVDRRHAEDPAAAELEAADLQDDRKVLHDVEDAHHRQQEEEPGRERDRRERRSAGEPADFTHNHLDR